MTQDQDVYRKVGRGGAGNFVPVSKQAPDDKNLEAQGSPSFQTDVNPSAPVRAGRGGAGNVLDAAQLPNARERERHLNAAVEAKLKQQPPGASMGGRGGAGNWTSTAGPEGASAGQEGTKEELERRVEEVVDQRLRMPEKVYHGREKADQE